MTRYISHGKYKNKTKKRDKKKEKRKEKEKEQKVVKQEEKWTLANHRATSETCPNTLPFSKDYHSPPAQY